MIIETNNEHMARPLQAESKSAREERFDSESWEALRESGNPVYDIVREYADVFLDKIPAAFLLIVAFGTRLSLCQLQNLV